MAMSLKPRLNDQGKPVPNEYEIPDGFTFIDEEAFADDAIQGMTHIQIPESVTEIGKAAFRNCTTLERITLPESCQVVKDWAFSGCKAARFVDMFDSLETIGTRAFENCGLVSAVIPPSLKRVGNEIFKGCKSLSKIYFPESWLAAFAARHETDTGVEALFGLKPDVDIMTY